MKRVTGGLRLSFGNVRPFENVTSSMTTAACKHRKEEVISGPL